MVHEKPQSSRHWERTKAFMVLGNWRGTDLSWLDESIGGFAVNASVMNADWFQRDQVAPFRSVFTDVDVRVRYMSVLPGGPLGITKLQGTRYHMLIVEGVNPKAVLSDDMFLPADMTCPVSHVHLSLLERWNDRRSFLYRLDEIKKEWLPIAAHNASVDEFGWLRLDATGEKAEVLFLASPTELLELNPMYLTFMQSPGESVTAEIMDVVKNWHCSTEEH